MTRWTFRDILDQTGRTAIVTGANTGIGLETARMLALKGANVVLACRNPEKGEAALTRIRAENPKGETSLAALDLSDLDSVAAFATAFASKYERLDLLVNNAGVMVPPLGRTKQGFELQLGTNHFGHFALTGRLLRAATDPEAESGSFWGPSRFFELNGPPARARIPKRAQDEAAAAWLWEESEKRTGVTFDFEAASGAGARRAA